MILELNKILKQEIITLPAEVEKITKLISKKEEVIVDCKLMKYTTTASWNRFLTNIHKKWKSKTFLEENIKLINADPIVRFSFLSAWDVVEDKFEKGIL